MAPSVWGEVLLEVLHSEVLLAQDERNASIDPGRTKMMDFCQLVIKYRVMKDRIYGASDKPKVEPEILSAIHR